MRPLSNGLAGAAVAAVALFGQAFWSQALSGQTTDAKPDTTFRSDTRLVVLHATVVDKNGRLLTNLPEKAFHVYENNVEQPIKKFLREDIPVSIGLIVDNSGSMRTKRQRVEASALALVKASNPQDEVFIVNF